MRTTGRRGEPDRSKTGASRNLPVRRESDNPRKGKPDRSEVGGGRPPNRVQRERQLKQDIGDIEATDLADGAVTEAKIASGAVTEAKIASGAVTSTKIGIDAITEDNISSASISTTKVNDGAITAVKLASGGQYHGAYNTQAETRRSGATTTTEIYYTARPDGDGYAESEVTTSTPAGFVIERKLYFSDKFDADPDTSGDWTLYTTQPADNTAFATAKASLLAGLSDTDGTANTRGTLPVSLKMEHRFTQDLLLEDYPGAAAGYSLRRISTNYTGSAIRIREDGTNTETDIGFDSNGDLDTAAIATHCGSNNGFVKTWYDQSGNGHNMTQSTAADQPQIYDGTAVFTKNGKPIIVPSDKTDFLTCATLLVNSTTTWQFSCIEGRNDFSVLWGSPVSSGPTVLISEQNGAATDGGGANISAQTLYKNGAVWTPANRGAVYTDVSGTQILFSSVQTHDSVWGTSGTDFGYRASTNVAMFGMQEQILYKTDQSANRTDIEADISAYWQSNKRTLDAYPGAAAAYSVRKLSNDYTGSALRVREASGNTEADIGFDSNGNLNTAAIASHCGSANGFVVTWYDQSGNAQDVTQATASEQPMIYNGTAVILENGKPAIDFDTEMLVTSSNLTTAPQTVTVVATSDTTTGTKIGVGYFNAARLYWPHYGGAKYLSWSSFETLTVQPSQDTNQHVFTAFQEAANKVARIDGGSEVTGGGTVNQTPNDPLSIGNLDGYSLYWKGTIQEVILWPSSLYSDVSAVESNINTYFSIY